MAFNSQDTTPIKKTAPEMTAEFKPFWINMIAAKHKENAPAFLGKLCYLGKEFNPRVECVRFFQSELQNEAGLYIELYDWDFNFFHDKERVLYYLPYNPHWKSETDTYKEVVTTTGKSAMSTYAVKLSDLKLINRTPVSSAVPIVASEVPTKPVSIEDMFDEAKLSDMFSEQEDDHYTKMTIRDLYCMMQNIPMSNKKWLNQLISKGQKWQQK